jgi:hypothetical protein
MIRSHVFSGLALCLCVSPLVAQSPAPRHAVLAVPAKYPSIQAAIDSAVL